MKTNKLIGFLFASLCGVAVSCTDTWDDHFDEHAITTTVSTDVEVYSGDVAGYLSTTPALSEMKTILDETGVLASLKSSGFYTIVACENDLLDLSIIDNDTAFARNSVSDVAVAPDKFVEGFVGLLVRHKTYSDNKTLKVELREDGVYIEYKKVLKSVKTDNGYVYHVDGTIKPRVSVYEHLKSLGDEYSRFKELVARFEEEYFDKENSVASGVDDMGNTIYSDSVILVRNTAMDRYTEEGLSYWNMFSENYATTLFVPSNDLIEKALNDAYANGPRWLSRQLTASDSAKFEKWIVQACFVDRLLAPTDVAVGAPDFKCVGGRVREVNKAQDTEMFVNVDAANWRPSVQTVNAAKIDTLSNGVAYYLTDFKIPNHVVIYRVKSRFYELWSNATPNQQDQYFRWTNWIDPMVINDAQSSFTLTEQMPTMYYHVLTAIPTPEVIHMAWAEDSLAINRAIVAAAQLQLDSLMSIEVPDSITVVRIDSITSIRDSVNLTIPEWEAVAATAKPEDWICSVEYDGLTYSSEQDAVVECCLPAGEYALRMGFKHSITYSLSIYFNDELLVKDMPMAAQGSNFHFDRGGASSMQFLGDNQVAYPEGFDAEQWYETDPKSVAYDTDGYQVANVTIPEEGNFKIRIESSDMAKFYTPTGRNKNNVTQLMMYHWCLRPTSNNY